MPADLGKIAEIKALVWEYLFIDRLLAVATEVSPRPDRSGRGRTDDRGDDDPRSDDRQDRADGEQARDPDGGGDDPTDRRPEDGRKAGPAGEEPWAVPPVPAGARLARTVTPPTNTHANPTPSSGAIASSCHGSVASAERPVRSANAMAPMTSSRSAPNRSRAGGRRT